MRSRILLSLAILGITPFVIGQAVAPSTPRVPLPAATAAAAPPAGPRLIIDDATPAAQAAVHLDSLKVHVTLSAPLAQTVVTLTFKNTLNRPLEGTLEFPFPENAAIVGYALDIPAGSGTLVEGVCVEKERARRIFETEQRRRVDPGLIEQTRGNNYRTRVHPIPAGGTRIVQLTYVSDLYDITLQGGAAPVTRHLAYSLPLDFAGTLSKADIAVEALGKANPDTLHINGLEGLKFQPSAGNYPAMIAQKSFSNIKLSGNLTVEMPAQDTFTRVERRTKSPSVENILQHNNPNAETYFLISSIIDSNVQTQPRALTHIGIIWDTSLSRATADHTAEFAMLKELAARQPNATFHVFSTETQTPPASRSALKSFPAKDVDSLTRFLADLPCDGALHVDSLNRELQDNNFKDPRGKPAFYIFFSDGRITLGPRTLSNTESPLFTLSSDPRADFALLTSLAESNRGHHLNLQRLSAQAAVDSILERQLPVSLTWNQNELLIDDVYPKGTLTIPAGQRITFTGRLLAPTASFSLNGKEITLTQDGASTTGIVPRFWAQQQAKSLELDSVRNADQLLALGKDFNIVTSRTSLLVLETVDQYVRHKVIPPQSAKDLYNGFMEQIEKDSTLAKQEEQKKIDHVLALWNKRVDWWNKSFTPPTREQLGAIAAAEAPATAPAAGRLASGGLFGNRNDSAPAVPSQTAAPAAAPSTPVPEVRARLQGLSASYSDLVADAKSSAEVTPPEATITIKPWSPDAPYLKALTAAQKSGKSPHDLYALYLAQRKDYFASPAFYLDCGNFFLDAKQRDLGIRILTNIAQLHLEDASLLRVAAYRLLQINEYTLAIDLFEQAKAFRPDEPQSWRDLALAYSAQGRSVAQATSRTGNPAALSDYRRSLELLNHVVMNKWERFDEIEVIALMEANSLWSEVLTAAPKPDFKNPLDPRLVKNLDCDLRILLTWDADNTDIDLHVIEPSTEEADYSHNLTLSGGMVSRDFTQGYGPEEYVIHHAPKGPYKIMANYFGSSQQSIQGPVTVQATVITNFGRPTEKRESLTLRLKDAKETQTVGEVTFGQ